MKSKSQKVLCNKVDILQFFSRKHMKSQLDAMASFLSNGRKIKVTLNPGGGSWSTPDSVTVGVPELFYGRSPEEITVAIMALLGHEVAHVLASNFKAFSEIGRAHV